MADLRYPRWIKTKFGTNMVVQDHNQHSVMTGIPFNEAAEPVPESEWTDEQYKIAGKQRPAPPPPPKPEPTPAPLPPAATPVRPPVVNPAKAAVAEPLKPKSEAK